MFRRRNVAGRSVKGCSLCTVQCGTLWYIVAHCGTLWHTLAHRGTLWYTLVHCGTLWFTVVHRGTLWRQAQSKGVVAGEPLTEPRGLPSGFEPLKGTAE